VDWYPEGVPWLRPFWWVFVVHSLDIKVNASVMGLVELCHSSIENLRLRKESVNLHALSLIGKPANEWMLARQLDQPIPKRKREVQA
jgi:hypothetical protein